MAHTNPGSLSGGGHSQLYGPGVRIRYGRLGCSGLWLCVWCASIFRPLGGWSASFTSGKCRAGYCCDDARLGYNCRISGIAWLLRPPQATADDTWYCCQSFRSPVPPLTVIASLRITAGLAARTSAQVNYLDVLGAAKTSTALNGRKQLPDPQARSSLAGPYGVLSEI
jgi:hypothetical protein